jgi:long-chain acyl-CoA synthetase
MSVGAAVESSQSLGHWYPGWHASQHPERAAVIDSGDGAILTYAQLDRQSIQLSNLFRRLGLRPGDGVAMLLENGPWFFIVAWAAQRSGLYYTPVSTHFTADEVAYIVEDCGARVFVSSSEQSSVASKLVVDANLAHLDAWLGVGSPMPGFDGIENQMSSLPTSPLTAELEGSAMLYSSGTSGRPKGIRMPLQLDPIGTPSSVMKLGRSLYGFGEDTVYLSPAPLYHSAPLNFSMAVHRLGGTVVVMARFDPEEFLQSIDRYGVSHTQVVPTMFNRLLSLSDEVRSAANLGTLRVAIHASAPCPVPVKDNMIEWWGPIIYEYYSGTEGVGFTAITSEEWLEHRGSVGRPLIGRVHILDDAGDELPGRQTGRVFFESKALFEYHNDPTKTAEAHSSQGWSTMGDVGFVDGDGYLYLTDRSTDMIISGGVNIYPREIENVLLEHPAVEDAAVVGIPDSDFGEQVRAIVQLRTPEEAGEQLSSELIAFCQNRLSKIKCPRSIEFRAELPRSGAGKLLKRELRAEYWQEHTTSIG